jgi:hypothetical protein
VIVQQFLTHGVSNRMPTDAATVPNLLFAPDFLALESLPGSRQLRGNGNLLRGYAAVFKTGAINRSATPPETGDQ